MKQDEAALPGILDGPGNDGNISHAILINDRIGKAKESGPLEIEAHCLVSICESNT
jgi:hypothetical protein